MSDATTGVMASAHLCDHLPCSVEANLILPSLCMCWCRSSPLQVLIVCLCGCRHVPFCIHFHLCVCVESPFRQLFGLAGGALSQSLIYSGPFEIIELTHLSDGERRNAKRSPGEVPAAPAPNLSCLQIAQSLHHNRWDSCLSFLPHAHSHTYMSMHTGVFTQMWQAPITLIHTYTQRCRHTRHLSQMRQSGRDMYCTHLQTHTQIHTHLFPPFVTVSLDLTCTLCTLSLQV